VPPNLEIVGDPPTVVDVRVRGSAGALGRVASGELVAVIDLALARAGQRLFHLTAADVRTPFGVEVVQVSPSSVSIRFEASVSKVVPVVPSFEGEPALGFVIGTVRADPATVEIVGAASALATVIEAITEPVNVDGAAKSFVETVAVGTADPSIRLRSAQVARVSVTITAAPVEWSVSSVPVQARNATRAVIMSPRSVTVIARGPQESAGAQAGDFDAYVDVAGLAPGEFDLPVRVVPPARVGVSRVEPEQVRVVIR
jgi:YbbR domain-containing protein